MLCATYTYGGPIGLAMRLFSRHDVYASITSFYAAVANICVGRQSLRDSLQFQS